MLQHSCVYCDINITGSIDNCQDYNISKYGLHDGWDGLEYDVNMDEGRVAWRCGQLCGCRVGWGVDILWMQGGVEYGCGHGYMVGRGGVVCDSWLVNRSDE